MPTTDVVALKALLDAVRDSIVARKKAENDILPFKQALDMAETVETQALLNLEVFRKDNLVTFSRTPRIAISPEQS